MAGIFVSSVALKALQQPKHVKALNGIMLVFSAPKLPNLVAREHCNVL